MPSLDKANISLGLILSFTDALLISPFVHGLATHANIVIPSVTGRGIFNMRAITAADVEVHFETNKCSV